MWCVFNGSSADFVVGTDVLFWYDVRLKQKVFDVVGSHPLVWLFGFVWFCFVW